MAIKLLLLAALWLASFTRSVDTARNEAGIALFGAKTVSLANLTTADCSPQKLEREFTMSIGICAYSSHYLVNNLKITHVPICANGDKAIAIFYEGTSCTGKPTFRSDKTDEDIEDRCLFGYSPRRWSMVFRCEDFESQAVGKYGFFHASLPGKAASYQDKPTEIKFEPADGIVTSYESRDCTVYNAKPPTFLPADTCLAVEDGHSIFVSQRVICADGKLAWLHTYTDSECSRGQNLLKGESYAKSKMLSASMGKICHQTDAHSVAYVCKDSEMKKFKDLPPYKPKEVKLLILLYSATDMIPASEPKAPEPETQKAVGGDRPNKLSSPGMGRQ